MRCKDEMEKERANIERIRYKVLFKGAFLNQLSTLLGLIRPEKHNQMPKKVSIKRNSFFFEFNSAMTSLLCFMHFI